MMPSPGGDFAPRVGALELAELATAWADTTLIGLYLVQDGRFVWVNGQFGRDTGHRPATLVGRPPLELVHPDDRDGVRAHAVAMLAGRRAMPYEYRYVTAEGEIRWALETVAGVALHGGRAVLGNFMDISERKRLEAQLAHRAFHDPLTGLPNRALLLDRLGRALERRGPTGGDAAVLYLDLDGFKVVNDTHGHHVGDELLREVARRLALTVRRTDALGRLGGDEFAVVTEAIDVEAAARRLAARIAAALAGPVIVAGHALRTTASCGIAVAGRDAVTADALLCRADQALYRAKAGGKGRAVLAAPP